MISLGGHRAGSLHQHTVSPLPEFPLRSLAPAMRILAQLIYDTREFSRLVELGDLLEHDACTDADILSHCRGPGEHVRGCWVVDRILEKG
jgi:hypothetical protein